MPTSPGAQVLLRTLRGYAEHPNVAGVLVLGLGCEMIAVDTILAGAGSRRTRSCAP
ncbi:UxaA family hydrolase [Oerskovia sp. M15]